MSLKTKALLPAAAVSRPVSHPPRAVRQAAPQPRGAERRAEPRLAESGGVKLRLLDHLACPVEGRLLDTSPRGFRAAHGVAGLSPGAIVAFHWGAPARPGRPVERGLARVVWTRITEESVESGFLILQSESS